MGNCSRCGKKFGVFDIEFKCRGGCNRTYCSNCMTSPQTDELRKKIELFPGNMGVPNKLNTEFSFAKGCSVACIKCVENDKNIISAIYAKYQSAINNINHVELYPKTYKGKIPCKISGQKSVVSNFLKNKTDTDKSLKINAVLNGHDIVYDVEWIKDTRSNGNYKFTVWQARGYSAKRG